MKVLVTGSAGFNFYFGQNFGALGCSRAVKTNSEELVAIRGCGSHKKYANLYQDINSRLDEIHAVKLTHRASSPRNRNNTKKRSRLSL
jgi:hypothetical protein